MPITDIKQAPGYDQQTYDTFMAQVKNKNLDPAAAQLAVLESVQKGWSFTDAISIYSTKTPKLDPPIPNKMDHLCKWASITSPGMILMALMVEFGAEQRQTNIQIMGEQTERLYQSTMNEASSMRATGWWQFGLGIASGLISIGSGCVQTYLLSGKAVTFKFDDPAKLEKMGNAADAFDTTADGFTKIVDSGSQLAGSMNQADIKVMQDDQERVRSMRESLKEHNSALKELISRSISTAESLHQGKTQMLNKMHV